MRYWRAVIKYGHVGYGRYVDVTRYLRTTDDINIFDMMDIIKRMPAVKKAKSVIPVSNIREITLNEYIEGKNDEMNNSYLQMLFLNKDNLDAV